MTMIPTIEITPLMLACQNNDVESVRLIISKGVSDSMLFYWSIYKISGLEILHCFIFSGANFNKNFAKGLER